MQLVLYNKTMESKELKRYNLPEDRQLLGIIDAKPSAILFFIFLMGITLVVIKQYLIGMIIIILSTLSFSFLPSRILIEFYKDYLVLYNHASKLDCEIIYYNEVVKWRYIFGISYDYVEFTLIDDSTHTIDAYSRSEFESYLNRFLKDKKDKTKRKK